MCYVWLKKIALYKFTLELVFVKELLKESDRLIGVNRDILFASVVQFIISETFNKMQKLAM
jgi:hypothetical protein